jgi:hypothetical protein
MSRVLRLLKKAGTKAASLLPRHGDAREKGSLLPPIPESSAGVKACLLSRQPLSEAGNYCLRSSPPTRCFLARWWQLAAAGPREPLNL